jgi:hypothetical protein
MRFGFLQNLDIRNLMEGTRFRHTRTRTFRAKQYMVTSVLFTLIGRHIRICVLN